MHEVIRRLVSLQGQLLREYQVGHPEWYAEMLVAAAYEGVLMPTNFPKYDMATAQWGRVQVKQRVQGTDGNQNRTNCRKYALGDFDHAAIVIFGEQFLVQNAAILSCDAVLSLVRPAGHVKWRDIELHPGAVCIAKELRKISEEKLLST